MSSLALTFVEFIRRPVQRRKTMLRVYNPSLIITSALVAVLGCILATSERARQHDSYHHRHTSSMALITSAVPSVPIVLRITGTNASRSDNKSTRDRVAK